MLGLRSTIPEKSRDELAMDFKHINELWKISSEAYEELWARAKREDQEMFDAWDKRVKEVAELERIFNGRP